MSTPDLVGTWLAAFLTLAIFSFLYKDNPFYKFAEHVFVGVSAGYWMCLAFWQTMMPNLVGKLKAGEWVYLFPLALGLLLLCRLVPRASWISRWPLAFCVGVFAGQNIVYTLQSQVMQQVNATMLPLWGNATWLDTAVNWILVVGTLTGLVYFYFSVEHKGPLFGGASRIGIWVLMIAFGAAFGNTVMARVSLVIGRVMFFITDWWPAAQQTFGMKP